MPVLGLGVAGTADDRSQLRARRKRLKESARYLLSHLSNPATVEALTVAPFMGNGELAFRELLRLCRQAPDETDIERLKQEYRDVQIASDVGADVNCITDLSLLLDRKNVLLSVAERFTDDEAHMRPARRFCDASLCSFAYLC